MTGPNSGIPDKRGALLLAAQRNTATASADIPNSDKITLSAGAENYLSGFRVELSEALRNITPMTPQMLGASLPDKFREIFRVFSESAAAGKVTEYLPLYYGTADHGEVDPYLDNVDYFPEITGAYEKEYIKLNDRYEAGEIDEEQYENSLNAINSLYDDFVEQADMSAILKPAGIEHPLFAMRGAFNADYKQAFLNARAYIGQNGSLDGITDEILSEGMTATSASAIRDMFSDEGKLLLYDTAAVADGCNRQEANDRLRALWRSLTGDEETGEEAETQEQKWEELKERLNATFEGMETAASQGKVSAAFRFMIDTALNWLNNRYFGKAGDIGDVAAKSSFLMYYRQMSGLTDSGSGGAN
jgi:hypothetical protein